jgi:hypothetical protein
MMFGLSVYEHLSLSAEPQPHTKSSGSILKRKHFLVIKHLFLCRILLRLRDESGGTVMESPGGDPKTILFRPFTKAERIQQLNDIDKVCTCRSSNPNLC